ncbi:MAG: AAA domain-containing protein [Prevotella sp.]|nr:AAA domain-containing protein [Prevotella sp.]
MRIIADTFTAGEIRGRAVFDGGGEVVAVYGAENTRLGGDCSYLHSLLRKGNRLNLVNARETDGKLFPELIVYEPDFLVDISLVASLFAEPGPSPLLALIRRLSPVVSNRYNLLGDFASQLLDEAAHGLSDRAYGESIAGFCMAHSLDMAACEGLDQSFHTEAKRQKEHIRRALEEDWTAAVGTPFSPEKIIIEPSFVCELLGLQGRMDFLQSDFRVVIEQKSGRAGFVPGNDDRTSPVAAMPHFVQLLLYRAVLEYAYGVPEEELRTFLLYSKYERPLARTGASPQLLRRATAVRNALVAAELSYANDGFDLLDRFDVGMLNVNNQHTKLWEEYQKPQFEAVMAPYRNARPAERAYCKRMLQFVEREFVLGKTGTPGKPASGVCGRWLASLQEKKEAGDILDNMSIEADEERVVCTNIDFGASNFRTGDVVTLFRYDTTGEPDCRKSIIHRAVVENIETGRMVLRLRMPQRCKALFDTPPGTAWALEHDFIDSSYAGAYRGLFAFLSADRRWRDLFLFGAKPATDTSLTLNGDYGAFNDLQLRVKQARELFLIIGPPGSGKTSFGMLYTLKEELTAPGGSVAVMAYTNRAVDEICGKLCEAGIDFVRIGSEPSCSPAYRAHMLENRVAGFGKLEDVRAFVREQKVFAGTINAFSSRGALFVLRRFTLAIIDEASQILEPQIAGLIAARHGTEPAIGRFVFIGDYKQLPAVVRQTAAEAAVTDPLLLAAGVSDCRMSLFERLLRRHGSDPAVACLLRSQGRMHEEIARVSNELFYNGLLSCVPLPHQTAPSEHPRVVFKDVAAPAETPSPTVNTAEAEAIANIVAGLDSGLTIGIIVPYRNQISAVRNALTSVPDIGKRDITIDTVERFQGSQREVIIYGFTVRMPSQIDFLTESSFVENGRRIDRKLNVVITRAMKYLFLVGNKRLLEKSDYIYNQLINNYLQQ